MRGESSPGDEALTVIVSTLSFVVVIAALVFGMVVVIVIAWIRHKRHRQGENRAVCYGPSKKFGVDYNNVYCF